MSEKENKIIYIPFGKLRPHTQALYEKNYDYVEAETAKYKNVNGSQRWYCKDCEKQLSVGSQVSIRRHLCSKKHLEIGLLLCFDDYFLIYEIAPKLQQATVITEIIESYRNS